MPIFVQSEEKQDVELYYNAAVEKYVKNDYDRAIEYMEKVYSLSAQQKYKNFIIKILYEAANKSYMMQDYKKAYSYTEKAKKYAPDDEKINQLHSVLEDLLSKLDKEIKKPKKDQPSNSLQVEKKEPVLEKKSFPEKKVVEPPTQQSISPQLQEMLTKYQSMVLENNKLKKENVFIKRIIFFETTLFVAVTIFLLILVFVNTKKLEVVSNNYETKIVLLQKENKTLSETNEIFKSEIDRLKKSEDWYKKSLEDTQTELKQKVATIEMLQKQLVELSSKPKPVSYKADDLIKQKHNEIVGYISQRPMYEEDQSEFDVEASRNRVALMLKNLYELNPAKAMKSIISMATNENPIIRINIVQGLIEIASNETFEILKKLYSDPDERVRREVIKRLWQLKQKIDRNEVFLKENLKNMVIEIVQTEKRKGEWLF
jgi:tetratricopeptide (TPR) repeat protein